MRRSFASDNNAPVAPEIFAAIASANAGDAVGYGHDEFTERAVAKFREQFGERTEVFFTFNGTGANIVALSSLLRPWESVLCPATAHLQTDECGAFERFAGSKVIPIPTNTGKIGPADLEPYVGRPKDPHFTQPRAISISQATEWGDLYELAEIRELCDFAHEYGLFVHVDGARISNAAAALGCPPRELTVDAGVDLLTFGGTKNGMMYGEALCFFNRDAPLESAPLVQKQAMQLASKMRYISAQFEALLSGDLWLAYAKHANAMTALLHERVRGVEGVRVTRPVRCNAIFATMNRQAIERLHEEFYFYTFDESLPEVRWMTHWATSQDDIECFADALRRAVAG